MSGLLMKLQKLGDQKLTAAATLIALVFAGCSKPSLRVSEQQPATFRLIGSNQVQLFEVGTNKGKLWLLYPSKKRLSLDELAMITYAEVPASCYQQIPVSHDPPPALLEEVEYYAVAVIADDPPVRVRFKISGGRIVVLADN